MKLIPFVTAGFPTAALFKKILFLLEAEGAGYLEVGVPYSDPLADGPVIQESSLKAIDNGFNLRKTLEIIGEVREEGLKIPLILFTYYNPLLSYGLDQLAKSLADKQINGILVPDLPIEESQPLRAALKPYAIPLISLIAPTSKERVKQIVAEAEGFLYIVSSLGVTGERKEFHTRIIEMIQEIKETAEIPVVLGFGISNYQQVKHLENYLDGYVIGSALIKKIQELISQLEKRQLADSEFEQDFLLQFREYVKELKL